MFYRRRNLTATKNGNGFVRRKILSKSPCRKSIEENGGSIAKELAENTAAINVLNNEKRDAQVEEHANSLDSLRRSSVPIEDNQAKSTLTKKVNSNTLSEDKVLATAKSDVVFFKKEKTEEIILSPENNSPVPAA